MHSIIHYSLKYEVKGFEDKHDYFLDRMSYSEGNNSISKEKEIEAQNLISQHLINNKKYPKFTIEQEYKLHKSNKRADIVIIENNIILAVIELKNSKVNIKRAMHQLESYYNIIIQNQKVHPKLFAIFHSEGFGMTPIN